MVILRVIHLMDVWINYMIFPDINLKIHLKINLLINAKVKVNVKVNLRIIPITNPVICL